MDYKNINILPGRNDKINLLEASEAFRLFILEMGEKAGLPIEIEGNPNYPHITILNYYANLAIGMLERIEENLKDNKGVAFNYQGIGVKVRKEDDSFVSQISHNGEIFNSSSRDLEKLVGDMHLKLSNIKEIQPTNLDSMKIQEENNTMQMNALLIKAGTPTNTPAYADRIRTLLNSKIFGGQKIYQDVLLKIAKTMQSELLSGKDKAEIMRQAKQKMHTNIIPTLTNSIKVYADKRIRPASEEEKKRNNGEAIFLIQSHTSKDENQTSKVFKIGNSNSLVLIEGLSGIEHKNKKKNNLSKEIKKEIKISKTTPIKSTPHLRRNPFEEKKHLELLIKSEFLIVPAYKKEEALKGGAIYSEELGLYYARLDNKNSILTPFRQSTNADPSTRGRETIISDEEYEHAALEYMERQGLYLGSKVPYGVETGKWIPLVGNNPRKSVGGFKVRRNTCKVTDEIETYKNVLSIRTWGEGSDSVSVNTLFDDPDFTKNQMRIVGGRTRADMGSFSELDKEKIKIWERVRAETSSLYTKKSENDKKLYQISLELGKKEVVRVFSGLSYNEQKIMAHPFIVKKGLPVAYVKNMRQQGTTLMIPLVKYGFNDNKNAELTNLQRIYLDKNKEIKKIYGVNATKKDKDKGVNSYETTSSGVYYIASSSPKIKTIKDIIQKNDTSPLLIVEGVGTAIFLSKAFEENKASVDVIAGMSIGGIKSLLEDIRDNAPEIIDRIVISPDNDEHKIHTDEGLRPEKNVGKVNSMKYSETFGVGVILPSFHFLSNDELINDKPSDWEDLYKIKGASSVVSQLNEGLIKIMKSNPKISPIPLLQGDVKKKITQQPEVKTVKP